MKKILAAWIIGLSLIGMSSVSAEVGGTITKSLSTKKTYTSAQAFLEAEGKMCETATDGINVIMLENGEFTLSTLAYIENPEYSCTKYKLSDNDMNYYQTLKTQIDSAYVLRVEKEISKYEKIQKMKKWSDQARLEAHQETIDRAEDLIFEIIMRYPQDIALPTSVNKTYSKLQLIKFELMMLDM